MVLYARRAPVCLRPRQHLLRWKEAVVLQYRGNSSVHILRVLVGTHARGKAEKGLSALCVLHAFALAVHGRRPKEDLDALTSCLCGLVAFIVACIHAQGWSG